MQDRNDDPIAWRESGSGPVALFLHGLGGNRSAWDPQLAALAPMRRCVAWDLPGYGASSGLAGPLPALADQAADLAGRLSSEPVDVIGLSLGGMIAQHLALRHPGMVRSLTLVDTSPAFGFDGSTNRAEWLASRVAPMHDETVAPVDLEQVVTNLVGPHCPHEVRDTVVASMRAISPAALGAACAALVDHDTRSQLHLIGSPTQVLVGEYDTETPLPYAQALAHGIPGASLHIVAGAGHIANLEAPTAVNHLLTEFWTRVEVAA